MGGKFVHLVISGKKGRDKTAGQGVYCMRLFAAFAIVIRNMFIPTNREPRRDLSNHQGRAMKKQEWDTTLVKPVGLFMRECLNILWMQRGSCQDHTL